MFVTAALAFWNERPEDLEACVKGIANIADRIVAVDGAYRRYPGATIVSPKNQAAMIQRAASITGIEAVIHIPDRLWAGQIEKRTFLLREAAKDSDWIVVVDADHIIHTDREQARAALAGMSDRVRTVGVYFRTPLNRERTLRESAATNWHANMAGQTEQMSHIVRALSDYRVVNKHWVYTGTYMGSQVTLEYGSQPDAMIGVPYTVEHRTLFRTRKQILAGRAFCNDRMMVVARTGQEDDIPGLPEPKLDYVTIPYRGRLRNDNDQEDDDMAEIKPKAPRDEPIRVLTLAEAEHALASGYEKVFVRINEGLMSPTLPNGEIVLFGPTPPKEGDLTLVHVLGRWRVRRLVDITPSGRIKVKSEHSPATHLATKFRGSAIWHGPKQDQYKPAEPKAEKPPKTRTVREAKPRRRQVATRTPDVDVKATTARRRGRPRKTPA